MSSTRARARTRTRTVIARSFAAALAFAGFASVPVRAQDASFFKGKTVTFYVGLSAGGGYDVNARLVARQSASISRAIRPLSSGTCRAVADW